MISATQLAALLGYDGWGRETRSSSGLPRGCARLARRSAYGLPRFPVTGGSVPTGRRGGRRCRGATLPLAVGTR